MVTKMSKKLGKKKAFVISQGILFWIYSFLVYLFQETNILPLRLTIFPSARRIVTLMMSMTADVCDLDELNNGAPRKEATFGAIYWLMVKFGFAISGLLVDSSCLLLVLYLMPQSSQRMLFIG